MVIQLMQPVTVEQVITMLKQLPPRDRLHVVGQVLPGLERELPAGPQPRKSLLGLCAVFHERIYDAGGYRRHARCDLVPL